MVSKNEFDSYEQTRQSGVTNMFNLEMVSDLTGLEKDTIREIMKNYATLKKQFYPDGVPQFNELI